MGYSYSDGWHRGGCRFERQIPIEGPVYYRHVYGKDGTLSGVIVDFETADDFHYELTAEDWERFTGSYLEGADEEQAFRDFFKSHAGLFAFEHALQKEQCHLVRKPI